MKNSFQLPLFLIIPLYFLGLLCIAYILPREAIFFNVMAFSISFGVYFALCQKVQLNHLSLKHGLILAVFARLLLLFAIPSLSDDFYRYFFDGHLILKGVNPYTYLPEEWVKEQVLEGTYLYELYKGMNSPEYYSVYPPLHLLLFALTALSGETLLGNLLTLRTMLIAFDLLNLFLIYQLLKLWSVPVTRVMLYALNPLVILELTGNLHFEGLVLTGLLATLYFFEKQRLSRASAAWAWAVGIKLTPLMVGPLLWRKASQSKYMLSFLVWVTLFLLLALGFLFIDKSYLNFWQSIRLYSSRFEFNASIYYLIRWVSGFFMDYNPIVYVGPFLSVMTLILILVLSFFIKLENGKDLAAGMVWIYLVYLLLQTVVHPWYLIPAFGLSVLTGNRVFLVWTGLVFLSYGAYLEEGVSENSLLLLLQYVLLIFSIFLELKKLRKPGLI